MTITLNGTTGITTPDVTSSGSLNIDASAPDDSLVVNASGNVGLGTTPTYKLDVSSASNVVAKFNYSGGASGYVYADANVVSYGSSLSGANSINFYDSLNLIRLYTNGSERARIDSSGRLLVGTTSAGVDKVRISASHGPNANLGLVCADDINGSYVSFRNSATTQIGSITRSGASTVAYNTSSDYRLKEDWQPMTGASERVKALKPVNFAWKVDGSRVDGFLAHEAQAVVPEAVTGEKDAVELVDITDEDGNVTGQEERPVYQGIDQSKLVPLLTAALQEALAKIDDLTARVSALEATNV